MVSSTCTSFKRLGRDAQKVVGEHEQVGQFARLQAAQAVLGEGRVRARPGERSQRLGHAHPLARPDNRVRAHCPTRHRHPQREHQPVRLVVAGQRPGDAGGHVVAVGQEALRVDARPGQREARAMHVGRRLSGHHAAQPSQTRVVARRLHLAAMDEHPAQVADRIFARHLLPRAQHRVGRRQAHGGHPEPVARGQAAQGAVRVRVVALIGEARPSRVRPRGAVGGRHLGVAAVLEVDAARRQPRVAGAAAAGLVRPVGEHGLHVAERPPRRQADRQVGAHGLLARIVDLLVGLLQLGGDAVALEDAGRARRCAQSHRLAQGPRAHLAGEAWRGAQDGELGRRPQVPLQDAAGEVAGCRVPLDLDR